MVAFGFFNGTFDTRIVGAVPTLQFHADADQRFFDPIGRSHNGRHG
jgi:hypothetical protein